MTATAFDTLQYVKTLESSGIPSAQAEAQAVALSAVMESNLVTPQDLNDTKTDLISALHNTNTSLANTLHSENKDLEDKIGNLQKILTVKLYITITIATAIIIAAIKYLL